MTALSASDLSGRRGLGGTFAGLLLAGVLHNAGAAAGAATPNMHTGAATVATAATAAAATAASAASAAAATAASTAAATAAAATPATAAAGAARNYSLTFKQLGAQYPLNITGADGSGGVPFSVRADEVVTAAKLKLYYSYSPALLPDLSHINVLVNDEVAYSIPVPKEDAGKNLERTVDIPARLITDFNRLTLQLIGHYSMQCEDPQHSSLWANIGNESTLELTAAPLHLNNDLSVLPFPFFDRGDVRRLELPIVFGGDPDPATLEAAGALSSWFGALAYYRGARFPAALGRLPKEGNAVVFAANGAAVPGLRLAAVNAPTVSVVDNPEDPYGKLLLIQGRDSADLKTAVFALVLGGRTLSGQSARITRLQPLEPRLPYDAPNWLPSDRVVRFGELARGASLNVTGYRPDLIRLDLRIPPDLFGWRNKRVPVNLKYRYTLRPDSDNSQLTVTLNNRLVQAIPLSAADKESLAGKVLPDSMMPEAKRLELPLFLLPPRAQLQMQYSYGVLKQGDCKDVLLDNARGAIDPDSTIDISRLSHFIAMPDLAAFAQTGFPFTRMADLSQTTVVLPDWPAASDYSAYLTLLGRLGASTGYPATGISVAQAGAVAKLADKDLLVIASGDNQPLLKQWARYMPASLDTQEKRFTVSDLFGTAMEWLDQRPRARGVLTFDSDSADALLTGFESPVTAGRSVVVVSGNRPQGLDDALTVLMSANGGDAGIKGSLVVVHGQRAESLLAEERYHLGSLGPVDHAEWFLTRHLRLFLLAYLLVAVLLTAILYRSLRDRAKRRINE